MLISTRDNSTPLYNREGKVHGASPFSGLRVDVQGNSILLPERGAAYRLVAPDNAYVLLADLILNPVTPQPSTKKPFTLTVEGYKPFSGELELL
jgi:hypothetical protein